jgi:hypothetical protein
MPRQLTTHSEKNGDSGENGAPAGPQCLVLDLTRCGLADGIIAALVDLHWPCQEAISSAFAHLELNVVQPRWTPSQSPSEGLVLTWLDAAGLPLLGASAPWSAQGALRRIPRHPRRRKRQPTARRHPTASSLAAVKKAMPIPGAEAGGSQVFSDSAEGAASGTFRAQAPWDRRLWRMAQVHFAQAKAILATHRISPTAAALSLSALRHAFEGHGGDEAIEPQAAGRTGPWTLLSVARCVAFGAAVDLLSPATTVVPPPDAGEFENAPTDSAGMAMVKALNPRPQVPAPARLLGVGRGRSGGPGGEGEASVLASRLSLQGDDWRRVPRVIPPRVGPDPGEDV